MPLVIVLPLPQSTVYFFTDVMMTFRIFIDGFSVC